MPSLRKLAPEEVQVIERKGTNKRQLVEQEYDQLLAGFETGDYGEVALDSGDTKPTVRHRINAAALRASMELEWLRGKSDTLKFKVIDSPFSTQKDEEQEESEMLASFELPEPEPTPEPEPVVAAPVPKKPARRTGKAVTDRQPYVEAP